MACLQRISRSIQLKSLATFARHLTSHNASLKTLLPQTPIINNLIVAHIRENPWIWQKNDKVDLPLSKPIQIDFPNGLKYVPFIDDPANNKEIELPTTSQGEISKQAARLIVIRRRKMKRHKLKKLRKRMKFEWAKRRQRRELLKEKSFQAILIQQCKDGEAFVAEKYVEERLSKFNEVMQQRSKKFKSVKTQM